MESQKLYEKAKKIIPGGTQLLSKRPEMFLPNLWPAYYKKAKGCEIWDLDDKKYIDMSYMGIGACTLGYADEDINEIITDVVKNGSMTTLNPPEEVELAEELLKIHKWASLVRFARTGGEAMSIAVRIARASTNKDIILFCGYHGWHDWYLAANLGDEAKLDGHLLPGLESRGVPRGLKGTALPFEYNNIETFKELIKKHDSKIAAVIMEPIRNFFPKKGFLEEIRKITKEKNIVLVFDEITSGFRLNVGGAHLKLGVNPDIAVFAKGMSNGYPMAAIVGNEVMDIAQEIFISSTYWTERIGPSAALATIKKIRDTNAIKHFEKMGKMVQEGWKDLANKNNLKIHVSGIFPLGHFDFEYKNTLELKTLFIQIMLEQGFLATNAFYASYAHKKEHVDKYLTAVDIAFKKILYAISNNKVKEMLKGPVCHSGFKRLT